MSLPKDASALDGGPKSKLKLGLFSYPVLQAADILIHRYVSVHSPKIVRTFHANIFNFLSFCAHYIQGQHTFLSAKTKLNTSNSHVNVLQISTTPTGVKYSCLHQQYYVSPSFSHLNPNPLQVIQ